MRARAPSATVEQKGARGRVSYVHRACIEARRTYLCFCSASGVTMPIPTRLGSSRRSSATIARGFGRLRIGT